MGLARAELWNTPSFASGARLSVGGFLPYRTKWSTTRSLINPEGATFSIPGNTEAASIVRKGLVLRRWKSDSDDDWWPIDQTVTSRAADGATSVDVSCVPLSYLLGTHGKITDPIVTPQNGIPATAWGFAGLTFTEMLTTYVTTNASVTSVLPWVTIGTIEPTATFDLEVDGVNTLALITQALAELARLDVLAEFDAGEFSRTGAISIYNAVGASAPKFFLYVGKNLQTLKRTIDGSQQYSRLSPKLAQLNGEPTAIGLARWKITGVASNVVTLADPGGGAGPIGFDSQFVTSPSSYLYIEALGTYVAITASSASAQTVALASGSGLSADMLVQFRDDNASPAAVAMFLDDPAMTSTTPPGIGVVAGEIDQSTLQAVPNLIPNAAQRDWPDTAKLPTGYGYCDTFHPAGPTTDDPSASGGLLVTSRNTDGLYTKVGGQSLHFAIRFGSIVSPPAKVVPWYPGQRFALGISLILTSGWDAVVNQAAAITAYLGIKKSDATLVAWRETARTITVSPGSTTPGAKQLPGGTFVEIELEANDVTVPSLAGTSFAPVTSGDITALSGSALGLVAILEFRPSTFSGGSYSGGTIEGYIDVVSLTPGDVPPDTLSEFGDANAAWQATNAGLALAHTPQSSYEVDAYDLARMNIDLDPSAITTLGGKGIIFDPELAIAFDEERLVDDVADECVEGNRRLTYSNVNKRLTDLLFQGSQSTSKKIASLLSSSGTTGSTTTGGGGTSGGGSGGTGLPAPVVSLSLDGSNVPTFLAATPTNVVKIFYAWSTTAQPTVADALAGTEIDAPSDYTASTTAISGGQTIYITVVGEDVLGTQTPPGIAHLTAPDLDVDDMPVLWMDNGDAGGAQAKGQYQFDSGMTMDRTGGWAGGNIYRTKAFKANGVEFDSDVSAEMGVTFTIDVNGQTITSDGHALATFRNDSTSFSTHVWFDLDDSRHVRAYVADSASDTLLATSTFALPASGRGSLELITLIDLSAGYVKGWYIDAAGTRTLLFDVSGIRTLSDNTGTNEDITAVIFSADFWGTSVGSTGGVDDILMGDFAIYDRTGRSSSEHVGYVRVGTTMPASNGHYADVATLRYDDLNDEEADGLLTCGVFTSNGQKNSYGLATISNVGSILAAMPFAVMRGSSSSARYRVGFRSGSTDVDNGTDLAPFTHWDGSLSGTANGLMTKDACFLNDPATSARWTVSGFQNAEVLFSYVTNAGTGTTLTQLGALFLYRPLSGGTGQGLAAGSRVVPVTPVAAIGFDSAGSDANEVHLRFGGSPSFARTGDYQSGAGSNGSAAAKLNSTYAGNTHGDFAGNVEVYIPQAANASAGFVSNQVHMTNQGMPGYVRPDRHMVLNAIIDLNTVTLSSSLCLARFFGYLSTNEHIRIELDTTRHIVVKRWDTSPATLATSTTAMDAGGLNGLEVEVGIDPTIGYVNVWKTDNTGVRTQIIAFAGNTSATATGVSAKELEEIAVLGVYSGSNGNNIIVDDIIVSSGGSRSGTGLGCARVGPIKPNGAGTYNDSTAHDHTKVIDDNWTGGTPDGDYNVFTAANKKDSYALDAVAGDAATILAVLPYALISLPPSASGSDTGRLVAVIGGTLYTGPTVTVDSSAGTIWHDGHTAGTPKEQWRLWKNPNTGAPFTPSDLNAMEIGYETLSHTNDQWLRQVGVEYVYAWTP